MSAPKPELTAELRVLCDKATRPFYKTKLNNGCYDSDAINWSKIEPTHRQDLQDALESLVREVVEIVARKSADIADQAIAQDASGYASTAILSHWGLK